MSRKNITGLLIIVVLFGLQSWQIIKIKSGQDALLSKIDTNLDSDPEEVAAAPSRIDQFVTTASGNEISARLEDLENVLAQYADKLNQISIAQQDLLEEDEAEGVSNQTDAEEVEVLEDENNGQALAAEKVASFEERSAYMDQVLNTSREDDPIWANSTIVNIQETMRSNALLSEAANSYVDCGAALCKIDTTIPGTLDNFKKQEFQWTMVMSMGHELPTYTYSYENLADGSQRLVFYMSRKGHALPQLTKAE